jgi:hypothetical protein
LEIMARHFPKNWKAGFPPPSPLRAGRDAIKVRACEKKDGAVAGGVRRLYAA